MKKCSRVMAFLLAVIIAVYGLPLRPADAAQSSGRNAVLQQNAEQAGTPAALAEDTDADMKFVRKDFDTETGILTMTLKIRPSEPGVVHPGAPAADMYSGRFINDGYFAFQLDSSSLRPIMADGTEIVSWSGSKVAYAGVDNLVGDFLDPETGHGEKINADGTDFQTAVAGIAGRTIYEPDKTGLLVSAKRKNTEGVLDCYFQFQLSTDSLYGLNPADSANTVDADGYVDVVDLRFQCYSGTETIDGVEVQKPATGEGGEKVLFSQSIRVPRGVAVDGETVVTDDALMLQEFYTTQGNPSSATLAKGAAGFSERKYQGIYMGATLLGYSFAPAASYYYYAEKPKPVVWAFDLENNNGITPVGFGTDGTGAMKALTLDYPYMTNNYIILGFTAGLTNTYSSDEDLEEGVDPDFNVPEGEVASSGMPRYKIPTISDEERLREASLEDWWVPERYDTNVKQMMLKYQLNSEVSQNSVTRPESEDLYEFLHNIHWQFALKDGTLLNSLLEKKEDMSGYKYLNLVEGTEETLLDGEYTTQQAVINKADLKYNGKRVQLVTDIYGETYVAPIGIVMVFTEDTPVTYYNEEGEQVTGTAYAPQLWIRKESADLNSYLWDSNNRNENGFVYLHVDYTASTGGTFLSSQPLMGIKLYKDSTLSPDRVLGFGPEELDVELPSGEVEHRLRLPSKANASAAESEANDKLRETGLPFTFRVADQYGFPSKSASGDMTEPTLTLEAADQNTKDRIASLGKAADPFVLTRTGVDSETGYTYTLTYNRDENENLLSVNDVAPGKYKITAVSGNSQAWEYEFTVEKDDNRFSYMKTQISAGKELATPEGDVRVVELSVQPPNDNWEPQYLDAPVRVTFVEMANQWRIQGSGGNGQIPAKYDVFPNMRSSTGAILDSRIHDLFDVTYTWTNASGGAVGSVKGLDMSNAASGMFNYSSDIVDGMEMLLTVTANVKGGTEETKQVNKYKFVFKREQSLLKRIRITNTNFTLNVPAEGKTSSISIQALADNQYGVGYAWKDILKDYNAGGVYEQTNITYGMWRLVVQEIQDGTLADAIAAGTIQVSNGVEGLDSVITINNQAEPMTLHAWVEFRGVSSDPNKKDQVVESDHFEIKISRGKRIANRVESISAADGKTTAYVPDNTNMSATDTIKLNLVVKDQFGHVMQEGTGEEEYSVKWVFDSTQNGAQLNNELLNNSGIHLDETTGVITVDACAAEVSQPFAVKAFVYQGGELLLNRTMTGLKVQRRTLRVTAIEVDQSDVDYPDSDSSTPWHYLTSSSMTQYSVGGAKDPVSWDMASWRLEEVTLNDGTVLKRVSGYDSNGDEILTGDIKLEGNAYTTTKDGYKNLLSLEWKPSTKNGAMLRLGMATDKNLAPVKIKVTAVYSNTDVESAPTEINIHLAESKPDEIEIWSTVWQNSLEVPDIGVTNDPKARRELGAFVLDQFDFHMKDESGNDIKPTWSIKETFDAMGDPLSGVTLDGNILSVDHTCQGGNITVVATYIQPVDSSLDPAPAPIVVSAEHDIGVSREAGSPAALEFTRIKDLEGFTVKLPGLNADGKSYDSSSFRLMWQVKDNFGVVMYGKSVTLELVSEDPLDPTATNPYNMVKAIGVDGTVTYACTDDWRDNKNDSVTITVKATLDEDPTITDTQQITLERQADIPGYAIPEMDMTAGSYVPSERFPLQAKIPSPDDIQANSGNGYNGRNYATFNANVYSQYGTVMAGEGAVIDLTKNDPGIELRQDVENGSAMILIGPQAGREQSLVAKPSSEDTQSIQKEASTLTVYLDRGASYADGVALGTGEIIADAAGALSTLNDNETEGYVGRWDVDPEENKNVPPSSDAARPDTFTFNAMVVDQYLANFMKVDPRYYIAWSFAEDYNGVAFSSTNDMDNGDPANVKGAKIEEENGKVYYQVSIDVGKEAMAQDETEKVITLNAQIGLNDSVYKADRYLSQQKFTLKKGASRPSYLYFKDVDKDGVLKTDWQRPTLAEGFATYNIATEIYDQYGYLYDADHAPAVELRLMDNLLPTGYTIENVYGDGVDPEEPAGAKPIRYTIKYRDTAIAEFTPATAAVTLFTACELTELSFEASCPRIANPQQVKTIKVHIDTDGPNGLVPARMEIRRDEEKKGNITFQSQNSDPIAETVEIWVWDQFGGRYRDNAAFPVWELMIEDEEGNFVPYQDFDDYGVVKNLEDWFVFLRPGSSGNKNDTGSFSLTVNVQPKQYDKNVSLRLVCSLHKGLATANRWNGVDDQMIDFEVRRVRKHAVEQEAETYCVTYQPGEQGTLLGEVTEEVIPGEHPVAIPTVMPEKGWGVKGWLADTGDLVKTPADLEIWGDTEFIVQYFDITEHAFLNGYNDNTVRPGKAVTRGEFVKMLVLAINNYDPDIVYRYPFSDVDPFRYYSNYVGYAYQLGIIGGYGDGTFRPNQPVTRAEAAKIIAKAARIVGKGRAVSAFEDVSANTWYFEYVAALTEAGIVNGYSDGTYRPKNDLTRAEAVKLLVLVMKNSPSKDELERIRYFGTCPFLDVTRDQWAYPYILRAAGAA